VSWRLGTFACDMWHRSGLRSTRSPRRIDDGRVCSFLTVSREQGRRVLDAANGRNKAFTCECSHLYGHSVALTGRKLLLGGLGNWV